MTGNNTLELNQACVVEAVQMWLDARFKEGLAPVVESVTSTTSGSGYSSVPVFTVKLAEKPSLRTGVTP